MNILELEKRLGIDISEKSLSSLLYHSSYQPQEDSLRTLNKNYLTLGNAAIEAACAVYLYINEPALSAEKLTNSLRFSHQSISEKVYVFYQLEDFVIKSNGENGKSHTDIAAKIMAQIYKEYGFLKMYAFLSDFMAKKSEEGVVDYRTILQEFAQAQKKSAEYIILSSSGPDHEKEYTCKVVVGEQQATASAIGKKFAQRAAAKKFVETYNIKKVYKKERGNEIRTVSGVKIPGWRKEQLNASMKLCGITSDYLSDVQMNEVLTHSSYLNEHRNLNIASNDCISVVGSCIFNLVSIEFIIDANEGGEKDINREKNSLLYDQNLSRAISNDITTYCLHSNGKQTERATNHLKIDIVKSIAGMMAVNSILQDKTELYNSGKKYCLSIIHKIPEDKALSYTTFLQEIVQTAHGIYTGNIELVENDKETNTIYKASISVSGFYGCSADAIGYGTTKVSSRNNASKTMLEKLLSFCPSKEKERILLFFNPEQAALNSESTESEPISKMDIGLKPVAKEKYDFHKEPIAFNQNGVVLYICKGTHKCRINNHEIISATGILKNLKDIPISLNINYCNACKIYFIGYSEFKVYQDLYGPLIGNYKLESGIFTNHSGYNGLAAESVLRFCGYTVSQAVGLTTDERRTILANMMEQNILGKHRIIEYLTFFINNSKKRSNLKIANQRWSEDLQWVRKYELDKQKSVFIKEIRKFR